MQRIILVGFFLTTAGFAGDVTLSSTFGANQTFNPSIGWGNVNPSQLAYPFTVPAGANYVFKSASLALSAGIGSDRSVTISLASDAGGIPGSLLETFTLNGVLQEYPNDVAPVTVTSSLQPLLKAGTVYWLVASATAAGNGMNWLTAGMLTTPDLQATRPSPTGTWTASPLLYGYNNPGAFSVTGTAAGPDLNYPPPGASGIPVTPTLSWNSSPGATSYDVYLGTLPPPNFVATVTGLNYTPTTLLPNQPYFWQVVAHNALGSNPSAVGSFTTAANAGPTVSATGVNPATGIGPQQTFALQFYDNLSAFDLSTMFVYFNATFGSSINSCMIEYYRPANILYLLNDAGTAWSSAVVGSNTPLANSQCSIGVSAVSVSISGPNLTLSLPLTFQSAFGGAKNVYGYAAGSLANSGWQALGTWTIPGTLSVTAVSVSPNAGIGLEQTFSVLYGDTFSDTDLSTMFVYFAANFSSSMNSCLVEFYRPSNTLYLMNDAGTAWSSAILGSSTPLANSQCSINASLATALLSSTHIYLSLPVTFSSFGGLKNIYAYAAGSSVNSAWQTLGAWTVPSGVAVNAVSVIPSSGSGLQHTFTINYSDTVNTADLSAMFVYFSSAFASSTNSCLIEYYRPSNTVYLLNDGGTAWSSGTIGLGVLSNSQCSVQLFTATWGTSNNTGQLSLPITFAPAFAGAKNIYAYAAGSSANSGWQTLGTWTVQ